MSGLSRRSFLRKFPSLIAKSAAAFAESLGEGIREVGDTRETSASGKPMVAAGLPAAGEPVEGIPPVHPWIGTARALAERLGHRVPYILLLGASGEAFRLSYDPNDPEASTTHSPVDTFLTSLYICGLDAQAAPGGPFAPALGSVEAALARNLEVAVSTGRGPAVLLGVDRDAKEVELA